MAYPDLTDKQRNYPYSGNMQLPPVVPETRGEVSPTGATPEQTAQGKQNWHSNAPQQYANNPVGTVQHNIFKAMEQQKPQPVTQPQNNVTATTAGTTPNPAPAANGGSTYNGGANNPDGVLDWLASQVTTPQQEERLRKASVANQRILAVGDALRHIGNIFNTVNYAPAQKLNSPVQEEYDRYQKGKALRDAANMRYLNYQQQKAAQDAKMRQAEAQLHYNMEKDARDYELKKHESDARANLNEARMQRYQTQMELDQARRDGIISDNEWRKRRAELYPALTQSQIDRNNRSNTGRSGGGGGSRTGGYRQTTTYTYNNDGVRTGSVVEKVPTGTYDQQGGKAKRKGKRSSGIK